MAWCPRCGRYWIVRTGRAIRHGVIGYSSADVIDPPDLLCPDCEAHDATATP